MGAASANQGTQVVRVRSPVRVQVLIVGSTAAALAGAVSVSWATRGMVVKSSIRVLVLIAEGMGSVLAGAVSVRTGGMVTVAELVAELDI